VAAALHDGVEVHATDGAQEGDGGGRERRHGAREGRVRVAAAGRHRVRKERGGGVGHMGVSLRWRTSGIHPTRRLRAVAAQALLLLHQRHACAVRHRLQRGGQAGKAATDDDDVWSGCGRTFHHISAYVTRGHHDDEGEMPTQGSEAASRFASDTAWKSRVPLALYLRPLSLIGCARITTERRPRRGVA